MLARLRLVVTVLVVSLGLIHASCAQAQERVDAGFKGTLGLGLIGAEVGAAVPALFRVHSTWAYIVFPVVGAAGGAVIGQVAIDDPDHREAAIATLTAGLALAIPALILTASALSYHPEDDSPPPRLRGYGPDGVLGMREGRDGSDVDAQAVERLIAKQRAASRLRDKARSTGMVRLDEGELSFSMPALALVSGTQRNGDWQVSGVSMSLMSGRF
jgi:uncharacterized membrane protein YeaQ/YmgE (transglycosylase-associated protein family)